MFRIPRITITLNQNLSTYTRTQLLRREFSATYVRSRRSKRPSGDLQTVQLQPVKTGFNVEERWQIVSKVGFLLKKGAETSAIAYFHDRMSKPDTQAWKRDHVFDAVIRKFIRHGNLDGAKNVYTRMVSEKLVASPWVRALMLAFQEAKTKEEVLALIVNLETLFVEHQAEFGDERFEQLLEHYATVGYKRPALEMIVESYTKICGEEYRLTPGCITLMIVNCNGEGAMSNAMRWLDYHSDNVKNMHIPKYPNDASPYTAAIVKIVQNSEQPFPEYLALLKRMMEEAVPPDMQLLNVLVRGEVAKGRFENAFQLYREVYTKSDSADADDFAFDSLFQAIGRYWQGRKVLATSDFRLGPNMVPPRVLFRQMLQVYGAALDGSVLDKWASAPAVAVLNAALSVFVWSGDDAGALAALASFHTFSLAADANTGRAVLYGLARRIHADLRKPHNPTELAWTEKIFDQKASLSVLRRSSTGVLAQKIVDEVAFDGKRGASLASLFEQKQFPMDILLKVLKKSMQASLSSHAEGDSEFLRSIINERIMQAVNEISPTNP